MFSSVLVGPSLYLNPHAMEEGPQVPGSLKVPMLHAFDTKESSKPAFMIVGQSLFSSFTLNLMQ